MFKETLIIPSHVVSEFTYKDQTFRADEMLKKNHWEVSEELQVRILENIKLWF
jgi:hypothetical protein